MSSDAAGPGSGPGSGREPGGDEPARALRVGMRTSLVDNSTAFDLVSVALGLGSAILLGVLLPAGVAWPLGAFAAAVVFALAQAVELAIAARVERRRGDPHAEPDG